MISPPQPHRTLPEGQFRALRVARLLRTHPDILEIVMDPPSDQLLAAIEAYRKTVRPRMWRTPDVEDR